MQSLNLMEVGFTLLFFLLVCPILGKYFYFVYHKKSFFNPLKMIGVTTEDSMNWKEYLLSVLAFNILGIIFVFFTLFFQDKLPLNPNGLSGLSWHLAINTAISFVTNTNWQSYGGESTMSFFSQMVALTGQNFFSAATGICVLFVIIRSFTNEKINGLGNFWNDLYKVLIFILLPLAFFLSMLLMSEGVIQNFHQNKTIKTLEGGEQIIPGGPVASQVSIKQLGTNGGGFFNTNGAHPFENPTPLSNSFQLLSILLIPGALVLMFGYILGKPKEGWMIFMSMFIILLVGLSVSLFSESLTPLLEGKEWRFGSVGSVMWSTFTTAASNGSVNSMHSSLTPLVFGVALLNMLFGEIIFGGVGSGLYGMLLYVLLTVFIAGLMVGRTPEYLGKKIEAFDIKMAIIGILTPSFVVLFMTAFSLMSPSITSSFSVQGVHGFSEIFYAFTSAANNNGSAFAGLNANTPILNSLLAFSMLVGRFSVIIPVMALAGHLSQKKITPESTGTFKTNNFLFVFLLIGIIVIVGALTFFPALSLGAILEHLLFIKGQSI